MGNKQLGFFRFRQLDDKYLLTNEIGDFVFLSPAEFELLRTGNLDKVSSETMQELTEKDFVHEGELSQRLISEYQQKNNFIKNGPLLHIIILTLNCNHGCLYCHASAVPMLKPGFMMSKETGRKVVETIFAAPSSTVTLEFTGGEPMANFEVMKDMIEYAEEKRNETGKNMFIALVTNLTLMDDEKLQYLLDHDVSICTSLDGPEDVHNKNRIWTKGNSYETVTGWMKKINDEQKKRAQAKDENDYFRTGALLTVSKYSFDKPKEIIDTYVDLGLNEIFIRPIHHFGDAQKTRQKISYTMDEFMEFYYQCMDYVIELNKQGIDIMETFAVTFLTKAFLHHEPNLLDIRSPAGSGNGQLAFNYDGSVYTCDEGRMLAHTGDDTFKLGNVHEQRYTDIMASDVVKTVVAASITDAMACDVCAYKPYCGVSPLHSYVEHGSIYAQLPNIGFHKHHLAVQDYLFTKLQDPEICEIFKKWVDVKSRPPLIET